MSTLKNIIAPLGIGVVVGIVLGALVLGGKTVIQPTGGLSGPSIPSKYLEWNGVTVWHQRSASLNTSTTTVCALPSPAATSTLLSAGIRLDTSSTTASVVHIASAATAYATTTNLATADVSANAQAFITATTSLASNSNVIGPNKYIVFGMQGGIGTFSPTGACSATFETF